MRRARCLLALAVVLAAISQTAAQIRAPPGKGPKAHARREDLPYIKCQACELLAKNAYAQAQALLARPPVGGRLVDEMAVIEAVEKLTTAWREEGQWITRLDLVESGPRLLVKEVASSQVRPRGRGPAASNVSGSSLSHHRRGSSPLPGKQPRATGSQPPTSPAAAPPAAAGRLRRGVQDGGAGAAGHHGGARRRRRRGPLHKQALRRAVQGLAVHRAHGRLQGRAAAAAEGG